MFEFLEPVVLQDIIGDDSFKEGQYGKVIDIYSGEEINWNNAEVIILSVHEKRGQGSIAKTNDATNIRKQFYHLFAWHTHIKIADIGTIKQGSSLNDTYAAMQLVLGELIASNKIVIILGNSHDLTLGQYRAYQKSKNLIEATCVDAKIDLSLDTGLRSENFLIEMLTQNPNYVKHYNHLGFQSYFIHPQLMETLDHLRFDCLRVGKVRENMHLVEPLLRSSHMLSMDINALQNSIMPCNILSTNGFAGDEACMLFKYAGMSNALSTIGIYGYDGNKDISELGASQIAQMIWYFIDGRNSLLLEKDISEKEHYKEFITFFGEANITFYQNNTTGRWWMKMEDGKYLPCSHQDYVQAAQNELPERWLRYQERGV